MNNHIDNDQLHTIKETITQHFPHLPMKHITMLGEGWMSVAYLINHELVFRFPKNEEAAIDTQKEIKSLPYFRQSVTLNIPHILYQGKQPNGYPFVGYRILPGEIMNEQLFHSLSLETQHKIAQQLALFMDQISSFNIDNAKELSIPERDFYNYYVNLFSDIERFAFPILDHEMKEYISLRFQAYLDYKQHFNYEPKLIHADISLDHLLFDHERKELSGIIDFGDMKVGDPDYEYIYILEEMGEAFTREIMNIRKEANIHHKLNKLSFFLTADNVLLLLEGIKRNDSKLIDEAKEIIREEMNKE